MEGYVIDRVEVAHGFCAVEMDCNEFQVHDLSSLATLNIESLVYDKNAMSLSIIVRRTSETSADDLISRVKGIINSMSSITATPHIRNDFVLLTLHGLLLSGRDGPATSIAGALGKAGVNIEYQVLNPASYSIMVAASDCERTVATLARHLHIRDSAFQFLT